MRIVKRVLSTYSADNFGVCSALYELGGLVVMHDASGCNSTYNTHDEPRWYNMDSLVFISGLTEKNAIFGNDDKLISDLVTAAHEFHPRFIAVCGRNCELKEGTHHLEDLFDERLIIREEGSGTRDIFETILTNKHHDLSEFSSLVEIGNMNAIKELLLRSVGISFLYEDVVKKELEEHQLFEITLDDFDVYHQMNVVWRKEKEHIQIIEEFLNVIHNEKKPF